MDLIADTNVWYDISSGERDPSKLKASANRLLAIPTSVFEILSSLDDRNFAKRKSAAQAILDHADGILQDCERHLVRFCGLQISTPPVQWIEACRAIAQSNSPAQLEQGVDDAVAGVARSVKIGFARLWRGYHYADFEARVIDAIEERVPGYKAARSAKKPRFLKGKARSAFESEIRSVDCQEVLLKGTIFWRALLVAGENLREPTPGEMARMRAPFGPYIAAYSEYLIRCATESFPRPNDLGDSECFLYLQDDRRFLSSDKKWVRIARSACPTFLLDPEKKVR